MIASPRTRTAYLTEIAELAARFEELAVAFTPVAGEVDVMLVPVSLLRRLMEFCQNGLVRLQKVAEYLPDEALSEILAAGDRCPGAADLNADIPSACLPVLEPQDDGVTFTD